MSVNFSIQKSRGKKQIKLFYYLDNGRGPGERKALNIFKWEKPKDQIQKNQNAETQAILDRVEAQLILDQQSIGTGYIPGHRFKDNFLDYYAEFVENNKQGNNRHMEGSFYHFKAFLQRDFLPPIQVTENLCQRYRKYLLDNFNGDTPANYFSRFKRMLKAATKEGYFKINPVDEVAAKPNKNYLRKAHLEPEEYLDLLKTPCLDNEVREAFILSCYTGLRWCDVKPLKWTHYTETELVFMINQEKTQVEHRVWLHPVAREMLATRLGRLEKYNLNSRVFDLPSQEMAYRTLDKWCQDAGIKKHITWHSARHSFSILLQDARVDTATVALLMGMTTTKYIESVYRRHRPKDQTAVIARLPTPVSNEREIKLPPNILEILRLMGIPENILNSIS